MKDLRLKEHRESIKMTQKEIADMFGMTQQAYSRWEKGISFPNSNQIVQLCHIFKCTPNELFGVDGDYEVAFKEWD